jgi:hypothetical protein
MDLRRLTPEERERKIVEIFRLANETAIPYGEIGMQVGMAAACISRILSGRKWSSISKPLGLEVRDTRVRKQAPKLRGVLTSYEISHAVRAVNSSYTELEAIACNPYRESVSPRAHYWMEYIIKTLWQLKIRRVAFLKGEVE